MEVPKLKIKVSTSSEVELFTIEIPVDVAAAFMVFLGQKFSDLIRSSREVGT